MHVEEKHPQPVDVVENAAQMFRNLRGEDNVKPVNRPKRRAAQSKELPRPGKKGSRRL